MPVEAAQVSKTSATFSVAGLAMELLCQSEQDLESLGKLWRQFFYLEPSTAAPAITFSFTQTHKPEPVGEAVYHTDVLRVVKVEEGFFLSCGRAWLELNPNENRAEGALPESFWQLSPYDQREFFLLSLLMMLRPHGLYGLHANGLAVGGWGLLMVGPSGSGKTTLTLSLLAQGWQFLSDDAVLLKDAEPLCAYAFRRGFSFTPQTETFFATKATGAMYEAQDKRVLDAEQLYPEQFTPRLEPRLIVFPEVTGEPESELVTLALSEALILLVQQSAGSMIDRAVAARQLELLKRLVQGSRCYRLRSGKDVTGQGSGVSAKLKHLLDASHG